MELEFDKYCVVDGSPTTVLPPPRRRPKVEKRIPREKPRYGREVLLHVVNEDFTEINFHQYHSVSCRDVPSRRISNTEANKLLKRGSLYHSSKEFHRTDSGEERTKIEFSRGNATDFSFGIVDALCSSDEEENRSSSMSVNSDCSTGSSKMTHLAPDSSARLPKSLSAKLALHHSPARSENDCSRASSPMKKMLFGKSKSRRSPLGCPNESKSMPRDFSNAARHLSYDDGSRPIKNESCNSPAHLQGYLKLERKHGGTPFFEFSLPFLEEVFVAETWKIENALDWVYTFRSLHNNRKKSHMNRFGSKDSTSLVGQMQISCYFCSELKDARVCDNSLVMEFVLYDTFHLSKSSCSSSPDVSRENLQEAHEVHGKTKARKMSKNPDVTGHHLAPEELHPGLEIAAMVIELPFEKRESLKYTNRDKKYGHAVPDLFDFSYDEKRIIEGKCNSNNNSSPVKMNVLVPSGNHSLPTTTESRGPYPLLDRWRLGGGCDCGGWDMACPLNVFGNKSDYPLISNRMPFELFLLGKKEKTPALTMTLTENGRYTVNFHAQLSALQAFSICVAILHTTEASAAVENDEKGKSLQKNSPRMFAEDDFKSLIEAVRQQEKQEVNRNVERVLPSFVINPPFSPIARV